MKKIYLTDHTTGLCETLFEQNQLLIINDQDDLFDEIIYCVDYLLTLGFNIVYLSTSSNYNKLSTQLSKIIETYMNLSIELIDIDSDLIGKNNVTYKLLTTNNTEEIIEKYNLKSTLLEKTSHLIDVHSNLLTN